MSKTAKPRAKSGRQAKSAPGAIPNDDIGEDKRLDLYRRQLVIRHAEQRAYDLFLQNLVKGQRVLPGRRFVVAGNGPLLLAVAHNLLLAGAEVAAVAGPVIATALLA